MSAGEALIHARGLTKQFGALTAVDGIDFDVQRGEAFGFLGPNGAGKSSTMRMIGCVSPITSGTLRVLGLDPAHDGPVIRGRLGVVPQLDTLDNELTVRENLIIYARYFGISRRAARERAKWAGARQKPRVRATPVDPALAARVRDALQQLTGFHAKVATGRVELVFADEHELEELAEALERASART